MRRIVLAAIIILMSGFTASAEGPAEQLAQTATTQRVNFASGGTIRLLQSYGDLYVEGWDQQEVELTVIKSTSYSDNPAKLKEKLAPRLDTITVAADRKSDSELAITTVWAKRSRLVPVGPRLTRNGVHLEYRIHIPCNSRLVVNHRGGSVEISNVTADVEASNRDGDILLMLPAAGLYSIDARSKMGHIASDFGGKTRERLFLGQKFTGAPPAATSHIRLRTGFWGITIVALPPEGQGLAAAEAE
jgi:hypothetical protein